MRVNAETEMFSSFNSPKIAPKYEPERLPSVYDGDYPEELFQAQLAQVHEDTETDRQWIQRAGLPIYQTNYDIVRAGQNGDLTRVSKGVGYLPIMRLANWDLTRSNPGHQWRYSPNYLAPAAKDVLDEVALSWQTEMGESRLLSVTSMVRSSVYQKWLGRQWRKLTITDADQYSGHQAGYAFDLDACGLIELDDFDNPRQINPRNEGYNRSLADESHLVLKELLGKLAAEGDINLVEELPGTQDHCFHVMVNPL